MANSVCDDGGLPVQRSLPSTSPFYFACLLLSPLVLAQRLACFSSYAVLSWNFIPILWLLSQDKAKDCLVEKVFINFRNGSQKISPHVSTAAGPSGRQPKIPS